MPVQEICKNLACKTRMWSARNKQGKVSWISCLNGKTRTRVLLHKLVIRNNVVYFKRFIGLSTARIATLINFMSKLFSFFLQLSVGAFEEYERLSTGSAQVLHTGAAAHGLWRQTAKTFIYNWCCKTVCSLLKTVIFAKNTIRRAKTRRSRLLCLLISGVCRGSSDRILKPDGRNVHKVKRIELME